MPSGYRTLLFAVIASAVAAFFSLAWNWLYSEALLVNFNEFLTTGGIIGVTVFVTTVLVVAHDFITLRIGIKAERWLNIVYLLVMIMSTLIAFASTLPLRTERPDLFIGLVVPMHLFPVMTFWALLPFFGPKTYKR